MSTRARDLLVLFALGLIVNGSVAAITTIPGYTDAYYYFNGGTFIARGQWVEPYLWNYVASPKSLPTPAFAYWQPLPSIIAAVGIRAVPTIKPFDAAQVPFVILAALLPLLTYWIGTHGGERRHALIAGMLTVFSGYYAINWTTIDTFTPYALTAGGALAFASWGRTTNRWWIWLLSGMLAGLAHLTRADGVLVTLTVIITTLIFRQGRTLIERGTDALLVVSAYGATMSGWWAHNLTAFGSFQAAGGLSALWLVDYNDLFSYPPQLSATTFFAHGWKVILQSKLSALLGTLARFVGVVNLVFLTPFTLIGAGRRWRHDWLFPAVLYGLALFVAMAFGFSLVGVRGGFIHSAGALLPFVFPAAVFGMDDAMVWAGRRRGWRLAQARQIFGVSTVLLSALITGYLVLTTVIGLPFTGQASWNQRDSVYRQLGQILDGMDVSKDVPVMVNNPPGFYTLTGHGGIPLPNGDEATLLRAADDYHIKYLVIDSAIASPLIMLFKNGPRSDRLVLIKKLDGPIYLYRINP